jgi:hypothetical protein
MAYNIHIYDTDLSAEELDEDNKNQGLSKFL